MKNILLIIFFGIFASACTQPEVANLVTTTENSAWVQQSEIKSSLRQDSL